VKSYQAYSRCQLADQVLFKKTIELGISLSGKYKAELSVIHVIDTTWLQGWSIPMFSIEEEHKKEMEKHKEDLHEIISAENKRGLKIKEFVREGIPSEIVLKTIKEEDIDLLILRSHERAGWNECLSEEIMMKSSERCPLLNISCKTGKMRCGFKQSQLLLPN